MKTARFNRLLASTALGVALVFASHAGMAQQSNQQIDSAVPMPNTDQLPPLTAKDIATTPGTAKADTKQDTAVPAKAAAEPDKATAEPAKTAAVPAPAVDPVTDQLRSLITGKLDHFISRKPDREGVEAFYKARDYKPLLVADGALDARGKAVIAFLGQVDTDGLNPADYPVPDFKSATAPQALAEDELKLVNSVLTYARHAQIGQIHFSRVGADIDFKLVAPEPAGVLNKLADASDVASLDSYNPPQPEFKALKEKLAELRKGAQTPATEEEKPKGEMVRIGEGKTLHVGMKDPRVVSLRKRLDIPGDKASPLYDDAVRDAVKTFQTEADIDVDGNLGPNTVRALNGEKRVARGPKNDPVDTVIVNMERWRWLPRDLGNPHVIVNVPDYTLTLYNDGKP